QADLTPVLYRGSGPMISDVLGGHIQGGIDSVTATLSHIQAGKLRPLAVTTLERAPQLPDVPTVAESGYPGYEAVGWVGLIGPRQIPPAVVQKTSAGLRQVLSSPEVRDKLIAQAALPDLRGPEEWSAFV